MSEHRVMTPGHAPTPFTAAQIRRLVRRGAAAGAHRHGHPDSSQRFRVLVEEWGYFDADPETGSKEGLPGTAQRLVYADYFPL